MRTERFVSWRRRARRAFKRASVVFALGGASWPRLGADGGWVEAFRAEGIAVTPLKPANCGFLVDWSPKIRETLRRRAAQKHSAFSWPDARSRRGDGHGRRPRRRRDLRALRLTSGSDRSPWIGDDNDRLQARPQRRNACGAAEAQARPVACPRSCAKAPALRLPRSTSCAKRDLFPKARRSPAMSRPAPFVSSEPLRSPGRSRPPAASRGARSTRTSCLRKRPGIFVAGEMIDWEAPTGGYLLQAAFATGAAAGRAAARWAEQ